MSLSLSNTQRVRVWDAQDKGKYGEVKFSSGRKDKRDDSYKNSNWSFVRFVFKAFDKFQELQSAIQDANGKGVSIVLTSATMTLESYEKGGETLYPKSPQITVFDFEFFVGDGEESKRPSKKEPVQVEDDIPF